MINTGISCSDNLYHCKKDKICISFVEVCDGYRDCFSNEDEENCLTPHTFFKCYTGIGVIPYQYICDFKYDCSDMSDEKYCSENFIFSIINMLEIISKYRHLFS